MSERRDEGRADVGIGAVILAAGSSSRLGQPKQLLPREGRSLLSRTIQCALDAGAAPVAVVLGDREETIRRHVETHNSSPHLRMVSNSEWSHGMGSSIACGVRALASDPIDAVWIMVCDQLELSPDILIRMKAAFRGSTEVIIESDYGGGASGPPVLFGRDHFEALTKLDGKTGARSVILRNRNARRTVPFPGGDLDIDSPIDLKNLRS